MRQQRRGAFGVTRWAAWALPRHVLALVVVVELLAGAVLVAGVTAGPGPLPDRWPWILAMLALGGILCTEASLGVERARHRSDDGPHIDLSSVWAFAAVVLLPGLLAGAVVVVVYLHLWTRVWHRSGAPAHRTAFSIATVVLAMQAAAGILWLTGVSDPFHGLAGAFALLAAMLAFAVVNMGLVVAAIVLNGRPPDLTGLRRLLGGGDEISLEFASLSMGALTAGAMATLGPEYALLVVPPLVVLHRTVLVRQLQQAASTDGKTGLLNAAAWHLRAARELRQAELSRIAATVLLLDLDHFKDVNDRHGHLIGDRVLAAVAVALRAELREDDLVGRFGGEEFVVLLTGRRREDGPAPAVVAERIRLRIAALRVEVPDRAGSIVVEDLSVSIGGASHPRDGADLTRLLEVADVAMYAAKQAGRNTVRMGQQPPSTRRPGRGRDLRAPRG